MIILLVDLDGVAWIERVRKAGRMLENLDQKHKEVMNSLYGSEYGDLIAGKLLDEIVIQDPVLVRRSRTSRLKSLSLTKIIRQFIRDEEPRRRGANELGPFKICRTRGSSRGQGASLRRVTTPGKRCYPFEGAPQSRLALVS